jgi:hypothetical protein
MLGKMKMGVFRVLGCLDDEKGKKNRNLDGGSFEENDEHVFEYGSQPFKRDMCWESRGNPFSNEDTPVYFHLNDINAGCRIFRV